MKTFLSLLAITLSIGVSVADRARFDNYRVYQFKVESEKQLNILREIENFPDGYSFWDSPATVGANAEIVVPPHKFSDFSEICDQFELKCKLKIVNVQS